MNLAIRFLQTYKKYTKYIFQTFRLLRLLQWKFEEAVIGETFGKYTLCIFYMSEEIL